MDKVILIFAGPNGAGKSTFAKSFLPDFPQCQRFINVDVIAARLSPVAPESQAIKAGRIMLNEIKDCVRNSESFSFETTLAGRTYMKMIPEWQQLGYTVGLNFLSLPNVDFAIDRVAERVAQGGHNIPEADIRRRFEAGLNNFVTFYKSFVNFGVIYDSSYSPAKEDRGFLIMIEKPDISQLKNNLLKITERAAKNAGHLAVLTAIQTNTSLIVQRKDGKIKRINPGKLRKNLKRRKLF